jgi:hypothetical protein
LAVDRRIEADLGRAAFARGAVAAAKQPDGQITSDFQKSCQALKSKIFRFSCRANQRHIYRHPVLLRGALAIVTNVGRVAVDAKVPLTNGAGAYGEVVWS